MVSAFEHSPEEDLLSWLHSYKIGGQDLHLPMSLECLFLCTDCREQEVWPHCQEFGHSLCWVKEILPIIFLTRAGGVDQ